MSIENFDGIFTPAVTPYDDDLNIDFQCFEMVTQDHFINAKKNYPAWYAALTILSIRAMVSPSRNLCRVLSVT